MCQKKIKKIKNIYYFNIFLNKKIFWKTITTILTNTFLNLDH